MAIGSANIHGGVNVDVYALYWDSLHRFS